MADQDLTELKFETDLGVKILVLDEHALSQLNSALATMRVPLPVRKKILSGKQKAPPLLYKRFHKMMQERLGASPVRIEVEGGGTAVFTEGATSRSRGKATRGRAKSLSVGEQIRVKRARKKEDARQGRIYRDYFPVVTGATIGRAKGDPTSNIFGVGKHRGTVYIVEQIAVPVPLPRPMPKTHRARARAQKEALKPYLWQARVLSHPWTRGAGSRAGFFERQGAGSAPTSDFAQTGRGKFQPATSYMFRSGELITETLPAFEGIDAWEEAQENAEKTIDKFYSYRVARGDIPPELERYVKDEVKQVRTSGRTPSLAPTRRKKRGGNPKTRTRIKAALSTRAASSKKKVASSKKKSKKRSRKNPPTQNGLLDDWKERRAEAKDMESAIKAKLKAEARVSRHEAKEAELREKRAEKAKERAGRSAERDRKRAAGEKYRAERIAEHGELYGTVPDTVGVGLAKLTKGGRKARARFAKLFTKSEKKKLSAAVRGQRSVFTDIGKRHIGKFEASFKKWDSSVTRKQPDFAQLLDAYDNLLYAHVYLTLGGGDDKTARAIDKIRDSLLGFLRCVDPEKAELLTQTVMKGARGLATIGNPKNPKNPTSEVHQEMGEGFLAESEKLWSSYCKTGSSKTLLDAYRVLELAYQEFEYTGDKKRMKQAEMGIKAARSEILSGLKKPARKTAKKKASKKKAKKRTKKASKKKAK